MPKILTSFDPVAEKKLQQLKKVKVFVQLTFHVAKVVQ